MIKNLTSALLKWAKIFSRTISGKDLKEMRELEKVMKHWHKEEIQALIRSQEAEACGNTNRANMWEKRCREARLRCEKDYREPMKQLTGKPHLFD